ncbi:polyribonucleotide nucleotidyltransferase [Candidatus Falkowbacteria bacterium]|nr:polyribonucleotide nucleotidyltransferase [Candidatus Falkowbacteria bacterium]
MSEIKTFTTPVAGRELKVEIGKLATHTNASCTVQYGETVILATAVMRPEPNEGVDYFPLMVDYEEKMYAAGKIKGSRFIKREGRPTDEAILNGRMIDRGLRPLFPAVLRNDVQTILTVLSSDGENDPDIIAITAASIALHISNIPWNGPLAGVRVGQINGEWVLNPTYTAKEKSTCDIAFSVTADGKVAMFEVAANEISEADFVAATEFGIKHGQKVAAFIDDIRKQIGKPKISLAEIKEEAIEAEFPEENTPAEAEQAEAEYEVIKTETEAFILQHLDTYLFNTPKGTKRERKTILYGLAEKIEEMLLTKQVGKDKRKKILKEFDHFIETQVTKAVLAADQRVDGRKLTEIRPLSAEVGLLPRTHGSALFARGETQILSTVTLGSPGDEQILDSMEEDGKKRYMHHYNDAPYSYGETGPLRGPGRRAIGHGALAEKALLPVLPNKEDFPYTIRVVSEVLSSNGSSSMGSTCGASLALMDAGVPIKKPVAGVAIGMASDEQGNYKLLTDLQDLEDGDGGMDFKVTGTRDGITAVQMDTKTNGLTMEIIKGALERAKTGRMEILDVMQKTLAAPRPELSPYAPRIISFYIDPDKIRDVIGPGGKIINEIIDATGVEIDIEQDGLVMITGVEGPKTQEAVDWVKNIVKVPEPGEVYEGKVVRIMDFGAFVEILPGKDGLVHISEIAAGRTEKVTDVLNIGDTVKVMVKEVDDQGRLNLSIKRLDPNYKDSGRDFDDRRPSGPNNHRGNGGPRRDNGRSGDRKPWKR